MLAKNAAKMSITVDTNTNIHQYKGYQINYYINIYLFENLRYISITGHFIDSNFNLHKEVLEHFHMEGSHTAEAFKSQYEVSFI